MFNKSTVQASLPLKMRVCAWLCLLPILHILKTYIEFIPEAEQVTDDSKKNEISLKTKSLQSALQKHFRAVLETQINSCVGSDKIDLLTELFF